MYLQNLIVGTGTHKNTYRIHSPVYTLKKALKQEINYNKHCIISAKTKVGSEKFVLLDFNVMMYQMYPK